MTTRINVVSAAFSVGADAFTTLILTHKIYANGRVEAHGMVRMPYSNRPKKGGGIAIPHRALNPNGSC